MPKFKKYIYKGTSDSGFGVDIKPTGIRRFPLVQWFLPYMYGTDIEFEIAVKDRASIPRSLKYNWGVVKSGEWVRKNWGEGEISIGVKSIKINVGYFSITGHHILKMKWDEDINSGSEGQDVVNFTIMDRDIYIVNWMHNLSSGIIGAIIGAIIALIIASKMAI